MFLANRPTRHELAQAEIARVCAQATRLLVEAPETITSSRSPRSPGGPNDYFSEGDYWWPDPANPGGPYIRRDGFSNPDNFNAHRDAMRRLSIIVAAHAAAFVGTADARFARAAEAHLRAWFADPATAMTPHLRYGQAITGITTGRGIGIVDTLHLIEVALAAHHLEQRGALPASLVASLKKWFAAYLQWLRFDQLGIDERDHGNNHSTCWLAQVITFALLTNDREALEESRERYGLLLEQQIAADGSFPLEKSRTKPFNYSIFNVELFSVCAQLLDVAGLPCRHEVAANGAGLLTACEWLFPAYQSRENWTLPPDVEYFEHMPFRSLWLLTSGLAFDQPSWIDVFQTLDPEPTIPELVRNMPFRQPMLWFCLTR